MITVQNLSFAYGRETLFRGLSFRAGAGECLVLAGPNGSGKSTLLSLISGVLKPSSGQIGLEGSLSLIPQGTALFEDMTVQENLLFFAGLRHAEVPKELPFSLDRYRKKKLSALSGGSKKRVSIACALLGDPQNVLFDEPCAGLDVKYQEELSELILRLKARGRTILYAGHEPLEYTRFFDRILFLGRQTPQLYEAGQFSEPSGDIYTSARNVAAVYRSFCENEEGEIR
ncbi:MAG: ABC transporter ATP-binding protein [Lachnospiraceae bacterium]|nr:ABC transporter ATP-binding protein [Lachnospiraceae bacterium]